MKILNNFKHNDSNNLKINKKNNISYQINKMYQNLANQFYCNIQNNSKYLKYAKKIASLKKNLKKCNFFYIIFIY